MHENPERASKRPAGNRRSFAWGGIPAIFKFFNALTHTLSFTYNPAGQLIEAQSPISGFTRYQYNAFGDVATVTNALGYATAMGYDSIGQLTRLTDTLGHTMTLGYDRSGRITGVTDTRGTRIVTYTYNPVGLLVTMTAAGGRMTQYDYDRAGRVTRVVDPLSGTLEYEYDKAGRMTVMTDALKHRTWYRYSPSEPVITVENELHDWVRYRYDPAGNVAEVTNSANQTVTMEYDAANRPVVVIDAPGNRTWLAYDAAGNVIRAGDSNGHWIEYAYDELNRVKVVSDTVRVLARYTYDRAGNVIQATDAGNRQTTYAYDALNRLREVLQPETQAGGNSLPHRYEYDALGNLSRTLDTGGNPTQYSYNDLNQLVRVEDPLGRVTAYGYDALGHLSTITEAQGTADQTVIDMDYDLLNRLKTLTASDGLSIDYDYDANGNRTVMTDTAGVTTYHYDPLDRTDGITFTAGSGARDAVRYAYGPQGDRTAMTVTTPEFIQPYSVRYGYDSAGRLETLASWDNTTTTYRYNGSGKLAQIDRPNGVQTAYYYDTEGRANEVDHTRGTDWTTRYRYTLDEVGNRIAVTEHTFKPWSVFLPIVLRGADNSVVYPIGWEGGDDPLAMQGSEGGASELLSPLPEPELSPLEPPAPPEETDLPEPGSSMGGGATSLTLPEFGKRVISYTYDSRSQLTRTVYSGDWDFAVTQIEYGYDGRGNLISRAAAAGTVATTTYTVDAADQVLTAGGAGYVYDARGNLVNDGIYTYTYDALNRMVKAQTSGLTTTAIYTYNGDGLWIAQAVNGTETRFTWDQALALPELLATSDGTRYFQGMDLEGVQKDGTWSYPLADLLGSVRQWSDAEGGVFAATDYDPYGNLLSRTGDRPAPIGFAGEWEDAATGLQYLRARWYSPAQGRFTQIDPFPGIPTNPLTQNPYAYALNNPALYTDPSGEFPWLILIAAGIFFGGGALYWNTVPDVECGFTGWHLLGYFMGWENMRQDWKMLNNPKSRWYEKVYAVIDIALSVIGGVYMIKGLLGAYKAIGMAKTLLQNRKLGYI